MPGDVRQALLGDPEDRHLCFGIDCRQAWCEAPLDCKACALREACAKRLERTDESEVLEHLRAELLRDPPDLVERAPYRLLCLSEHWTPFGGHLAGDALKEEQDTRQALSNLVVKLGGNSLPLCLLRGERAAPALASLRLQPPEHVVERAHQISDLPFTDRRQPPPGTKHVRVSHPPRQPLEGRKVPAEKDVVHRE